MKYLAIFDEALCTPQGDSLSICERETGSPHRHFTAFQMETDESGILTNSGVTSGLHQKEVITLYAEAPKLGIATYPVATDESAVTVRLLPSDGERVITLSREYPQHGGSQFYLDVRSTKDMKDISRTLNQYPDTTDGYKTARQAMLNYASAQNIQYMDFVETQVLQEK